MKIVEVIFDLKNPNQKPQMNIFEVSKETERYYHVRHEYRTGRMFFKPNMNAVKYKGMLNCSYVFLAESDDIDEIETSTKMQKVILEIFKMLEGDLKYYNSVNEGIYQYYKNNYITR